MVWTAMDNRSMTPEEKLLRIIESGEKGELVRGIMKGAPFWSARAWIGLLIPNLKEVRRVWPRIGSSPEFNLEWINRILIIFLGFVVVGIIFNVNRTRVLPQDLVGQPEVPELAPLVEGAGRMGREALRPLTEYLKVAGNRDLFRPAPLPKHQKPTVKKNPSKPQEPTPPNPLKILQERVKSLKLVGISWGEQPKAMIEDQVKKETSFLKVGETINEVKVKVILRDRAILSYGDAEYDLF